LFSIVDVYDAITSDRPYRPAWSDKEALAYIQDQAGKLFDPDIVPVFLELVERPGQSVPRVAE
jgi:HD-GYP domain-containing protein (c-di-GMP phosphodiesterase class II)